MAERYRESGALRTSRPDLSAIWDGKPVTTLDELQVLCDESVKMMGYWRQHLARPHQ